jgi:hypothetical protein
LQAGLTVDARDAGSYRRTLDDHPSAAGAQPPRRGIEQLPSSLTTANGPLTVEQPSTAREAGGQIMGVKEATMQDTVGPPYGRSGRR